MNRKFPYNWSESVRTYVFSRKDTQPIFEMFGVNTPVDGRPPLVDLGGSLDEDHLLEGRVRTVTCNITSGWKYLKTLLN